MYSPVGAEKWRTCKRVVWEVKARESFEALSRQDSIYFEVE
jgi:hypothetical protein